MDKLDTYKLYEEAHPEQDNRWVDRPNKQQRSAAGSAYMMPVVFIPVLVEVGILLWYGRKSRYARFHAWQALIIDIAYVATLFTFLAVLIFVIEVLLQNADRSVGTTVILVGGVMLLLFYSVVTIFRIIVGTRVTNGKHIKLPLIGQPLEDFLRERER
ncbi:MAG: hypothetical protein GYB68_12340 [Chloroflexi bacterium]|nr:hypothetical protein [Chloroflexota bacterium]